MRACTGLRHHLCTANFVIFDDYFDLSMNEDTTFHDSRWVRSPSPARTFAACLSQDIIHFMLVMNYFAFLGTSGYLERAPFDCPEEHSFEASTTAGRFAVGGKEGMLSLFFASIQKTGLKHVCVLQCRETFVP
jgi:hypothetical protein